MRGEWRGMGCFALSFASNLWLLRYQRAIQRYSYTNSYLKLLETVLLFMGVYRLLCSLCSLCSLSCYSALAFHTVHNVHRWYRVIQNKFSNERNFSSFDCWLLIVVLHICVSLKGKNCFLVVHSSIHSALSLACSFIPVFSLFLFLFFNQSLIRISIIFFVNAFAKYCREIRGKAHLKWDIVSNRNSMTTQITRWLLQWQRDRFACNLVARTSVAHILHCSALVMRLSICQLIWLPCVTHLYIRQTLSVCSDCSGGGRDYTVVALLYLAMWDHINRDQLCWAELSWAEPS